jgi:hypothetical protein
MVSGRRTHFGMQKNCPELREAQPPEAGQIVSIPEVAGLHHAMSARLPENQFGTPPFVDLADRLLRDGHIGSPRQDFARLISDKGIAERVLYRLWN